MLGLMLVASSGALAPSAVAQSSWDTAPAPSDERSQYESPRPDDPAGTGLPDWADSGASAGDSDWSSGGAVADGVEMNNEDPPAPPPQLPVDGGLSLLALAGAGYAANRLRRRNGGPSSEEGEVP